MGRSVAATVEKKGYFWWLGEEMPGGRFAPKNALPGVLTISEDGLSAVVITGSLMRSSILQLDKKACLDPENSPDALKDRTIVGKVDEDQRCVYLRNVVYKHPGRTIDGRVSESFNAGFCLIGNSATPLDPASVSFSRISISLKGLEEWRRNESISVIAPQEDGLDHSQIVNWAIEQNEYMIESGRICLRTDVHCNAWDAVKTRDITFHQYDWLDYAPEVPTSPELLKQEFGRIEEFLAVLTGNYYNLDWPLISTGESGSIESYTLYFFRNKEAAPPPQIQDLWTIFPQIREQFGVLYGTAKRIRQEYGAGFYLRLAALRSASMYIEHRFMNLIWGIEQLHRTLHPDAKGPSSDYEMIQNLFGKIDEHLNADSRRWFKRQLEFATEPQLKQRIVESFAGLPWQIESAIALGKRAIGYVSRLSCSFLELRHPGDWCWFRPLAGRASLLADEGNKLREFLCLPLTEPASEQPSPLDISDPHVAPGSLDVNGAVGKFVYRSSAAVDLWGFRADSRNAFLMRALERGEKTKEEIRLEFLEEFPLSAGKTEKPTFNVFFTDIIPLRRNREKGLETCGAEAQALARRTKVGRDPQIVPRD